MATNRVIFSGQLFGSEEWSCGFSYASPSGGIIDDYEALTSWGLSVGALNAGSVLPASLRQLLTTAGTIRVIRLEARSSTGKLIQAGEWTPAAPIAGSGAPSKTFQSALVLGIRTGRPGRSYRGRAFWPALGAVTSNITGRISTPSTATIASETAKFLADVGRAVPGPEVLVPYVESRTLRVATRATSIDVGDVLDVMRRRRDKLTEQRVDAIIPQLP